MHEIQNAWSRWKFIDLNENYTLILYELGSDFSITE